MFKLVRSSDNFAITLSSPFCDMSIGVNIIISKFANTPSFIFIPPTFLFDSIAIVFPFSSNSQFVSSYP